MKYEKIYQQLKTQYTDEEIVEAMVLPADLTGSEAAELATEMKHIRLQKLRTVNEEDRIMADLMRLRFDIEHYLTKSRFSPHKTFGKYLEEYIRIVKKSRKEIAADIAIHYTKLSRIINDKEEPNMELSYRLGKYSGNIISAALWWKLMMKKQEFVLSVDKETRTKEEAKVKNYLIAS